MYNHDCVYSVYIMIRFEFMLMIMWILFAIQQELEVKCIHGYADSVRIIIEFGTDV